MLKDKTKVFFGAEEVDIDTVLKKKNKQIQELREENEVLRRFGISLVCDQKLVDANDFIKSGVLSDVADKLLQEENEYLRKELTLKSQEYFYDNPDSMEKKYPVSEEDYQKIKNYDELIRALSKLHIQIRK